MLYRLVGGLFVIVSLILLVYLRPFGERGVEKLPVDALKRCHCFKKVGVLVTLKNSIRNVAMQTLIFADGYYIVIAHHLWYMQ